MTSSKMSRAPARSQALPQAVQESGGRGYETHVGGHRLDDDAGDVAVELGDPVVRDHERVGHGPFGHARRAREPQRGHAAPPAGQQRVGVAVVAAVELHHPVPPGRPPGDADRAHRRLGARGDEAHLLASRDPLARSASARQHLARAWGRRSWSPRRPPVRWPRRPGDGRGRATPHRRTGRGRGSDCPRRPRSRDPRPGRR